MPNLQLSLKKQWFDLTKSGVKTEDYREITPYWYQRLILTDSTLRQLEIWISINTDYKIKQFVEKWEGFKKFESNIMTLGYPKSTDSERILKLEHKGIEIRTGNPEWGAEPNKLYFVIKHGSFLA